MIGALLVPYPPGRAARSCPPACLLVPVSSPLDPRWRHPALCTSPSGMAAFLTDEAGFDQFDGREAGVLAPRASAREPLFKDSFKPLRVSPAQRQWRELERALGGRPREYYAELPVSPGNG